MGLPMHGHPAELPAVNGGPMIRSADKPRKRGWRPQRTYGRPLSAPFVAEVARLPKGALRKSGDFRYVRSLPLGSSGRWSTTPVRCPEELTVTTPATIRHAAAASFALTLWAALAAPAQADDALRTELAAVAQGIAEAAKGVGHEGVAGAEFTGPGALAASCWPV